jgi:hypothetical protein
MAEFTERDDPWIGIIGTDSKSVLDTLKGNEHTVDDRHRLQESTLVSGGKVFLDPLSADWDILIEIQHALQLLPGIKLQYVKGHQDRLSVVARLPLMAQLNVEADAMAARFQDNNGAERPFVWMTPRTHAHLHFANGTVTSRYAAAIRREYSGEALLCHIKRRNNWMDATVPMVNWDSHGAALSTHIKTRLHYSKLVHDILPTSAYLNRQDKGKRLCPCCSHPKETRDHVLRCPALSRNRWRHSFLTSLGQFCDAQHTAPSLKHLLLDTCRSWLYHNTDEVYNPNPMHHPASLRSLILQQTEIGWRQLFNGRFCVQWSRIQDAYLYRTQAARPGSSAKLTGDRWQTKLILFFWEQWRVVWKLRNESLHGKDTAARAVAEANEVKRRLKDIYDLRGHMEPSVQELLCQDIHHHLAKPTWATTNWLHIHVPLFQASVRRVKARAIQGVRNIRMYFGST